MTKQELKTKLAELKAERDEARRNSFPATEYTLDLEIRKIKALILNAN